MNRRHNVITSTLQQVISEMRRSFANAAKFTRVNVKRKGKQRKREREREGGRGKGEGRGTKLHHRIKSDISISLIFALPSHATVARHFHLSPFVVRTRTQPRSQI